ncbi:hypothetical protein WDW89_09155 [Deltaproteobacteria bacterium TL4]
MKFHTPIKSKPSKWAEMRFLQGFAPLKAERLKAGMVFGVSCACLLIIPFLLLSGCKTDQLAKVAETKYEIEKEYKRGPLTFLVKVSQKEITIADKLELVMEVHLNEDNEVKLPEFGEKLDQFGIVNYRSPAPQLMEEGKIRYLKKYELEPFLSGEYTLPPMKVAFWQKGKEGETPHEVESEPLTIKVTSLLPEAYAELRLKEIAPPVEIPFVIKPWMYVLAGVGGLVLFGIGGFYWWYQRRDVVQKTAYRSAHEIAYDALERLLAEQLVEKGEVKLFYFQVSNILRHYIENRFLLRAPEQTTEEFLHELKGTETLAPSQKEVLKQFLRHCDMVKFAKHQPQNDEIQGVFDACKQFIKETLLENEV